MNEALIVVLIPAICIFLGMFFNRKLEVKSPDFMFVFVWFFYGFSVPIDYILGVRLAVPWDKVDYSSASDVEMMIWVSILFYSALIGYWAARKIGGSTRLINRSDSYRVPPLLLLILVISFFIAFNLTDYLTMSRMERNARLGQLNVKLAKFLELAVVALSCLFILYSRRLFEAFLLFFILFAWAAIQGDRSSIVIPGIAFLVRLNPRMNGGLVMVGVIAAIAFLVLWKPAYSFIQSWLQTGFPGEFAIQELKGISRMEPVSSYNLTVFVVRDYSLLDIYAGFTVFILPALIAIPRFVLEAELYTLSEEFLMIHLPHIKEAGGGRGFGVIAEFYLNFWYLGPFLFGVMWGAVTSLVIRANSKLLLFIILVCTFRIFRSDVASVFKSYIVMFMGIIVLWLLIVWLLSKVSHAKNN